MRVKMAAPTWNLFSKIFSFGKRPTSQILLPKSWQSRALTTYGVALTRAKTSLELMLGLPERPKRPLTPFFRHMERVRPQLKAKHPNASSQELSRLAAGLWEEVKLEEKDKLEKDWQRDWQKYRESLGKYEELLTPLQKESLKQAKEASAIKKEQRLLRRTMKEMGRPKRPASAFVMYSSSQANSRGNIPHQEWLKSLGETWKNMSEDEKAPFMQMQREAMTKYSRTMAEWEDKMLKEGHEDLVRVSSQLSVDPAQTQRSRASLKLPSPLSPAELKEKVSRKKVKDE